MRAPVEAAHVGPVASVPEAARSLARQKARATALVGFCALAYAAAKAIEWRHPAVPYVAAFAEAAIIGRTCGLVWGGRAVPAPVGSSIELSIGKDPQCIRINGALVGGLLGLVIFAATRLAMG